MINETELPVLAHDISDFMYKGNITKHVPNIMYSCDDGDRDNLGRHSFSSIKAKEGKMLTQRTRDMINDLEDYMLFEIDFLLDKMIDFMDNVLDEVSEKDLKMFESFQEKRQKIKQELRIYQPPHQSTYTLVNKTTWRVIESAPKIDFYTYCSHVYCGPGKHKVYGEIPGGYGWRCDFCPINTIKQSAGEGNCKPCKGVDIDNGIRTKCIDPYSDTYPIPFKTSHNFH